MDELDQLFKDILAARHEGATTAQINAALAENPKWGGRFQNEADVRQALTQRDLAAQAAQESGLTGGAQAAVRGYTSGLSDEIAGLGDAALALPHGLDAARQAYTGIRDAVRATQRQFASAHPIVNAVTQVGGALAPAIATAGLVNPASSFGGLALQGAKIGAAQGAVSGFGEGQGLGGSARGALIGAPTGAVVGGVAGPLTKLAALGAGAIYRGGRAILAPALDAEASRVALLGRFLTPEAVARFRRLQAVRPVEAMIADANPPLLDVVANKSTAAGDAADALLQARNAREGGLLAGQLENAATGTVGGTGPGIDAVEATVVPKNLTTLRARLYKPLEEKFRVTPSNPAGQDLQNLLGTDEDVGRVFRQVVPKVEQPGARAAQIQHHLTPGFRSWQSTLDRLDDDAAAAYAGNRGNEGRKLGEAAGRLRAAMESAFPGFAEANAGYRTAKEVMGAQVLGKPALQRDPREIARDLAALGHNPDAQSAYRMAALDPAVAGLRGIRPEANAFREALVSGNQDLTPRLQALFPNPSDLDEFLANAEVARSFRRTLEARAGSKTQGRAALESEVFKSPGLGVGNILNRMGRLFQNFGLEGRDARIADAVAPDIFASGPAAEPVIARAEAARADQAFRDRLTGRAANIASSVTGRFPQESALLSALVLSRLPWLRGSTPRMGQ